MKRLICSTILLVLLVTLAASGETARELLLHNRVVGHYDLSGVPGPWRSNANVFFVDAGSDNASDADDGRHGQSWRYPFNTIDFAIGQGTAAELNLILCAPTHTDTVIAADGIDIDVSGTCIYGLGEGGLRPTVSFTTAAAADVNVAADDCWVEGINFLNALEGDGDNGAVLVTMLYVDGDDITIKDCSFRGGGGTGADANGITMITVCDPTNGYDADSDRLTIDGCTFYDTTAGNGDEAIQIAKDCTGITIKNSKVYGDFDEAGIEVPAGGNAQVDLVIENCYVKNLQSGQHAIQVNGTGSTGMIRDCIVETDGTFIDAGGLQIVNTPMLTTSTDSDSDVVAWDLGTNYLDHLLKTAVASGETFANAITDESILAYLMTKTDGDVSDFDFTTDSLEAIADALAAGTGATAAIDADNLDHLASTDSGVAADVDLTTLIADGSFLSHIMTAGADTSDFQASTDSLEAISVAIAAVQTDADTLTSAAGMVPLVDPNYVSYDAPRLLSVTTGSMADDDYDTEDSPVDIFTVTGDIMCRVFAIIGTQVTSTSNTGTLELGVAGDTACLLVQDVADGTAFDAGDVWTLDQAPDTPSAECSGEWVIIGSGTDIELVVGVNNMIGGVVTFYIQWIPLSANAAVVAAAP